MKHSAQLTLMLHCFNLCSRILFLITNSLRSLSGTNITSFICTTYIEKLKNMRRKYLRKTWNLTTSEEPNISGSCTCKTQYIKQKKHDLNWFQNTTDKLRCPNIRTDPHSHNWTTAPTTFTRATHILFRGSCTCQLLQTDTTHLANMIVHPNNTAIFRKYQHDLLVGSSTWQWIPCSAMLPDWLLLNSSFSKASTCRSFSANAWRRFWSSFCKASMVEEWQ